MPIPPCGTLGIGYYHQGAVSAYGSQLFIALWGSAGLLIVHYIQKSTTFLKSKRATIKILKATYGAKAGPSIDVTDKVNQLLKESPDKNRLQFKVDDPVFLEKSKVNDPMPGSPKVLRIEYWYRHDKTFEQGNDALIEN